MAGVGLWLLCNLKDRGSKYMSEFLGVFAQKHEKIKMQSFIHHSIPLVELYPIIW